MLIGTDEWRWCGSTNRAEREVEARQRAAADLRARAAREISGALVAELQAVLATRT